MTTATANAETPQTGEMDSSRRTWLGAAIVAIVSAVSFTPGVTRTPTFPDETAYVAQSYYFDLLMNGRRDDWAWLEYHAYDLPPLPKYVFGAALRLAARPMPDRLTAGAWFRDIESPLVAEPSIQTARWPVVAFGIAGCLGLYALGTIGAGRSVGLTAALLLAINPLYRLHAHRAMSDVPAESLILLALAAGLLGWTRLSARQRRAMIWISLAGVLAGLAALAKLNGVLAAMVLMAWCAMGLARSVRLGLWRSALAFIAAVGMVGVASVAVFIALNPYVLARPSGVKPVAFLAPASPDAGPIERLEVMIRHRIEVSDQARERFPHNALTGPGPKLAAVLVQGFGRFGPLGPPDHDSRVAYERFDWQRDWGAILWLPLVLAGAALFGWRGRRQAEAGRPPTALALLVMTILAGVVVTAFIPLAWDRYYLSLQPSAALLGAAALVWTSAAARARWTPLPWRANRG